MSKKNGGRPTKFDATVAAEVIRATALGALVQDAAAFAGITRETLNQWINKGASKPKGHKLREFSDAVTKARSSVKVQLVGKVVLAAGRDWKAGAWMLGVTDPKNYGPKIRVTLEEEFTSALQRIEQKLPPEVFNQVLAAIAEGDSESTLDPAAGIGPADDTPAAD